MDRSLMFRSPPMERIVLKRLDKVRLGSGQVLIVTEFNPHKPANCYSGVLENGHGKPYVFGPKHRPTKIGEVTEDHPALRMNQSRTAMRNGDAGRPVVQRLMAAVNGGDIEQAKLLCGILSDMGY